jgi:hypothetical protein
MRKRKGFNPKRCLAPPGSWPADKRIEMAEKVQYTGNPQHKSKPNDYNLRPPVSPRPGKTLCDALGEFPKQRAEELLRHGLTRGMVSVQERGGWPQNVWAVFEGNAFESQLENHEQGTYHGYPMPVEDDFRKLVLAEWPRRE